MNAGHDPLKTGISKRFVDTMGFLSGWGRAVERKDIVGSCRQPNCGGLLQPLPTHQAINGDTEIPWYGAECLNCGHEVWSPDGRTLVRSSRRGEQPTGWWDRRMEHLRKLRDLSKGDAA